MVSTIAHQILPLFGIEKGDFLAFKVVVCAGIGVTLYEHFRPTPLSLPRGENWSLQVKEAAYKVFQGKRRYLDQMAACLRQRRKVLVLGPSGVGKTETVRSFVKAVHRGDYPELQGKTFFYFNAADLQNEAREENILSWLKQKVGRHQEDIVIIFDEIHTVCRGVLADQLKTTLDRCFPYFIGITTDKEY